MGRPTAEDQSGASEAERNGVGMSSLSNFELISDMIKKLGAEGKMEDMAMLNTAAPLTLTLLTRVHHNLVANEEVKLGELLHETHATAVDSKAGDCFLKCTVLVFTMANQVMRMHRRTLREGSLSAQKMPVHKMNQEQLEKPLSEFLQYLCFRVDESIRSLEGSQHREYHRLSRYQQKTKDKMGLTQTLLLIPLSEQVPNTVAVPPPSLPTTCSTDDYEYEQIYSKNCQSAAPNANGADTSMSSERADCQEKTKQRADCQEQRVADCQDQWADCQDKTLQVCRVLYDFTANSEDELDVRAEDCVIVEGRVGEDWLVGYTICDLTNGRSISKTGRFPASYVT